MRLDQRTKTGLITREPELGNETDVIYEQRTNVGRDVIVVVAILRTIWELRYTKENLWDARRNRSDVAAEPPGGNRKRT